MPKLVAKRITDITDRDFFRSLDLKRPGLEAVAKAVRAKNYRRAYKAWGKFFATQDRPAPFPDAEERVTALSKDAGANAIQQADRVVGHEIQGWHDTTMSFGPQVDFNADYGQSGQYGFHYWGWARPLETAWLLTGEEKYADCFEDLLNQYIEQRHQIVPRIPRLHPIWYELGCGAKTLIFSDLYHAFGRRGRFRVQSHERAMKFILSMGRWLLAHESTGYRQGNWQMSGCYGLLYIGRMFPEFKDAPAWLELAAKRLLAHVDRDFFADGGHSERCLGYGSGMVKRVQDMYDLCAEVPALAPARRKLRGRLRRMYDWFLALTPPTGEMLAWGDGGYSDSSGILQAGARFSNDGVFLWPVRQAKAAPALLPEPVAPAFESVDLRPSGYAVMRSGWEPDDLFMGINYGVYGGGHTHCDLLNFDLFAYGQGLVLDTARYGAYDNPLDRIFRRATSHNQIVVDDADFDRAQAKGLDVLWAPGEHVDFFSASHQGYGQVTITRTIIFVRGEYWLVRDLVSEHQRRHVHSFYLHAPSPWRLGKGRRARAGNRPGILTVPAYPEEIRHVLTGTTYGAADAKAGMHYPERHWLC